MVGRYQSYPDYKASEVYWLVNFPSHWGVKQLKYLCTYNDEVLTDTVDDEYEIEYVDIGSVSSIEGITKKENMAFGKAPSRARRVVNDGDIIISTVRTYLEAIAHIDNPSENLIVSTGFAVIRPNKLYYKKYAAYSLRTNGFIKEVVARSVGVSYPAINASDLVNIKVPKPTFEEQKQIANFLDHETAKIDQLIEKQQQLIKLLKEKRQAVISHAVTKGLNPKAPMKDSGVEWLGEVPAHWDVRTVSKLSQKITNGYVGPTRDILVSEGVPYIQATHIKRGKVNFDNSYYVRKNWSEARTKSILIKGDVLIVQTGAGTGDIGLVSEKEEGYNCHALIIVKPIDSVVSGEFLSMTLQSQYGYSALYSIRTGGMHPHLNCSEVQYVKLPVPPRNEQNKVISYITEQTSTFDKLITKQLEAIALMKERKASLISAAVTGKIDVRNWNSPQNT